jgi:outer membrane immunogenic protein
MRGMLSLSAVSAVLLAGAAQAADLPVKAPVYKAPVVAVRTWTGFYIGGNAGYGWSAGRTSATLRTIQPLRPSSTVRTAFPANSRSQRIISTRTA